MNLPPTGLPVSLVAYIRDELKISTFIETGTGNGRTLSIVKDMFPTVYTIEINKKKWGAAKKAHGDPPRVNCVLGDTLGVLPVILSKVGQSIIFLDAHCISDESITCPLLDEIDIVLSHRLDHVIIVDDWWVFSTLEDHRWPEMIQVMNALHNETDPFIFTYDGDRDFRPSALLSIPRHLKSRILEVP